MKNQYRSSIIPYFSCPLSVYEFWIRRIIDAIVKEQSENIALKNYQIVGVNNE